jgi:hypothetical protein
MVGAVDTLTTGAVMEKFRAVALRVDALLLHEPAAAGFEQLAPDHPLRAAAAELREAVRSQRTPLPGPYRGVGNQGPLVRRPGILTPPPTRTVQGGREPGSACTTTRYPNPNPTAPLTPHPLCIRSHSAPVS